MQLNRNPPKFSSGSVEKKKDDRFTIRDYEFVFSTILHILLDCRVSGRSCWICGHPAESCSPLPLPSFGRGINLPFPPVASSSVSM